MVPDSITSESQEAAKVVTSAKLELSPESEMELVLDSISPDSKMEVTANSEEVALGDVGPDVLREGRRGGRPRGTGVHMKEKSGMTQPSCLHKIHTDFNLIKKKKQYDSFSPFTL